MKDYTIQLTSGVIGSIVGFCFGELNTVFYALCFLVVADFISGLLKAGYNKGLSSEACFRGIVKKVFILIMVAMGHVVDAALGITVAMNVIMFFYMANEALSIVENAAACGLPFPEKILSMLEQLRHDNDKEDNEDEH